MQNARKDSAQNATGKLPKRSGPVLMRLAGESPARERTHPGWGIVLEIARRRLEQFVSLESKIYKGDDPEIIHDFRVASRRLQQVVVLLYPKPCPRKIRRLHRLIRRSRSLLSPVRNGDVLMDMVEATLARKRTARKESWQEFLAYLREKRSADFERSMRKLGKVSFPEIYSELQSSFRIPPQRSRGSAAPAAPVAETASAADLPERLAESLTKFGASFAAEVSRSQSESTSVSLHTVRVAAKRLRYVVEVLHELGVPGGDAVLVDLRRLQQLLGDWHDLEVLEQSMAEMIVRPGYLRAHIDTAMGIERLILRLRTKKKRFEEKYFAAAAQTEGWSHVSRWVGDVVPNMDRSLVHA